jgi:beta-lactamase superfamily II metal-dependent hydrolase
MTVSFIDVGQGDSELIQSPSGKVMLIDAGPTDAGSKVVNYLRGQGINTINIVVATHPHEDHIGGMSAVLNGFAVKQFIDSGYPHTTSTYENMLNLIDNKNIPFRTVANGDTIAFDSAVSVQVLNPQATFSDDINQNAIVLKIMYGKNTFLFTGDAGEPIENSYAGNAGHADILKVAHHGSSTSSGSSFLSKITPSVSVIEVGSGNSYGHPTSATLQRLQQAGSKVYRTDLDGTITITSDGNTYSVDTAKSSGTTSIPMASSTQYQITTQPVLASGEGVVCDCSSNRYNCPDFSTQAAAQACYNYCMSQGKGDIHKLDADKNGKACESNK